MIYMCMEERAPLTAQLPYYKENTVSVTLHLCPKPFQIIVISIVNDIYNTCLKTNDRSLTMHVCIRSFDIIFNIKILKLRADEFFFF